MPFVGRGYCFLMAAWDIQGYLSKEEYISEYPEASMDIQESMNEWTSANTMGINGYGQISEIRRDSWSPWKSGGAVHGYPWIIHKPMGRKLMKHCDKEIMYCVLD